MPFNIAEFNSSISKGGIAQTSHFEGWILGGPGSHPRAMGVNNPTFRFLEQGMRFRIESANLPGRQLTTLDQNYHGPARAIPYRFSTQPVTLSIILSKDMREREIFMKWQDFLIGHYRTTLENNVSRAPFDTKYYHDGVGTIQIRQYSYPLGTTTQRNQAAVNKEDSERQKTQGQTAGGPPYELQTLITLHEAYPINVNDIQMSWGDEGYAKLQVEIRYHYHTEWNKNWGTSLQGSTEATGRDVNQLFRDFPGAGNI